MALKFKVYVKVTRVGQTPRRHERVEGCRRPNNVISIRW